MQNLIKNKRWWSRSDIKNKCRYRNGVREKIKDIKRGGFKENGNRCKVEKKVDGEEEMSTEVKQSDLRGVKAEDYERAK
jgi:hypothetical protein